MRAAENGLGTREFTGENALVRETLPFFGQCGSWGRRSGVGLDLQKLHRTLQRELVLEDQVGKMLTRLQREFGLHFKA